MFFLLKAIKDLLTDAFGHVMFRDPDTETEVYAAPAIFIGALPPKRSAKEEKDFPFIVLRPSEGEDDEEDSTAVVKLICGVYTAQEVEGGVNDVMNMVDRCRRFLLEQQILDGRYVLNLPVKWSLGDEEERNHPHPFYHGTILTTWSVPPVNRLLSVEDEIGVFGSGYPD